MRKVARSSLCIGALASLFACTGVTPADPADVPEGPSSDSPPSEAGGPIHRLAPIEGLTVTGGSRFSPRTLPPVFIPDTIKDIASIAGDVAGAFSVVGGVIGAFAKFLSIFSGGPDEVTALFQQLSAQLDAVAGTLSWQMSEEERENNLADSISDLTSANEILSSGGALAPSTFIVTNTSQNVARAKQPLSFQRLYVESATNGLWKNIISDRPVVTNGFVYDWRLGVPELMQLIGFRVTMIAMIDPNFRTDGIYFAELLDDRSALLSQITSMAAGVRCNIVSTPGEDNVGDNFLDINFGCADINTGTNEMGFQRVFTGTAPYSVQECSVCTWNYENQDCDWTYDQACVARDHAAYQAWYQANVTVPAAQFGRDVPNAMPIFQVQAMADTLYHYTHPGPDLAANGAGLIPSRSAPSLCLDVKNGLSDNGTPLMLFPCNAADAAQHWAYDRKTQSLVATSYGKCLDVSGAANVPGTQAQIWDCNGNDSQRWTYDPEAGVLTNARGNVLDIQHSVFQSGIQVWTWPRNNSGAQQWLAE